MSDSRIDSSHHAIKSVVQKTPALFLDRDGVIISDSGYAKDAKKVRLIPGILTLIERARALGWKVLVVTNQSGLGRGWIKFSEYQAVSRRMLELLAEQNLRIDAVYFAPFYEPEHPGPAELQSPHFQHLETPETGLWNVGWRKPFPGMLWAGAVDFQIDLAQSVMIGDRVTDQIAGYLAGVHRSYLLQSQIAEEELTGLLAWESRRPNLIAEVRAWMQASGLDFESDLQRASQRSFRIEQIRDYSEVELR